MTELNGTHLDQLESQSNDSGGIIAALERIRSERVACSILDAGSERQR